MEGADDSECAMCCINIIEAQMQHYRSAEGSKYPENWRRPESGSGATRTMGSGSAILEAAGLKGFGGNRFVQILGNALQACG
jgi:hypothetical protein